MNLYCWALSWLNWLLHGSPYISGHDYLSVDVDDFGRGTLVCQRCGHQSRAW